MEDLIKPILDACNVLTAFLAALVVYLLWDLRQTRSHARKDISQVVTVMNSLEKTVTILTERLR